MVRGTGGCWLLVEVAEWWLVAPCGGTTGTRGAAIVIVEGWIWKPGYGDTALIPVSSRVLRLITNSTLHPYGPDFYVRARPCVRTSGRLPCRKRCNRIPTSELTQTQSPLFCDTTERFQTVSIAQQHNQLMQN